MKPVMLRKSRKHNIKDSSSRLTSMHHVFQGWLKNYSMHAVLEEKVMIFLGCRW